jgi:ligand-binding sensor domain-containing protein/AraC-like DNA-binding protein
MQDEIGYIWIGTPGGLLRFDGIHFTRFDNSNTPEIRNDYITAIYQNSDKSIWVGTKEGGAVSYANGKWNNFNTENGLSDNFVHTITGDWRGRVWIGTDYGLNVIEYGEVKSYDKNNGLFDPVITALSVGVAGEIFIGTFRSGIFRMYEESIDHFGYQEGIQNLSVTNLFTDENGRLWIATLGGLYYLDLNDKIVRMLKSARQIPVTDFLQYDSNQIWFSSMIQGIETVSSGRLSIPDLPDEYVRCLLKDRNGTVWAGTDGAGLLQISKSQVDNIILPGDQIITCATMDDPSNIWIGTRNKGVFRMSNGNISQILNRNDGLGSNQITALYLDNKSWLWIGTRDAGLFAFYNNKYSQILPEHHITGILVNDAGSVWIGTTSGLYLRKNDRIVPIINDLTVNALYQSSNNEIFVATTSGLFSYSDSVINKKIYNLNESSLQIMSVCLDQKDRIFTGTNGSGIYVRDGNISKQLTIAQGLPDNHIASLLADDHGNIWCGSYNGIFMIDESYIIKYMADSCDYIIPLWFTDQNGMNSNQCIPSPGFSNSNKLYFPAQKGIAVFDADIVLNISPKQIPVQLEYMRTLHTDFDLTDNTENIFPANDTFTLQLTAFDYTSPEKIHIRYKLRDHDREFRYITPSSARSISYSDLEPGSYILQIQATSQSRDWNQNFKEYTVSIPYPFYRTLLFQIIFYPLLLIIGLGLVFIRRNTKRKKLKDKYKTVHITTEQTASIVKGIDTLFSGEKIYLDPDLTLKDLAAKLKFHPNQLSRIINEKYDLSYNDFVNKYRVNDAMRLLSDPDFADKTILEIMYMCGFYSKSVFNTAFKRFSGKTPSEFRRSSRS